MSASFCDRPERLDGQAIELGHLDRVQLVLRFEAAVFERVGLVAGQLQALLVEGVLVDDQRAAVAEVAEVGRQRGRVHRHQAVDRVARRVDVGAGELDLKARDAGLGAARGADFGGEVGERGDVVAGQGGGVGELAADELHAVAGVAAESDGGFVEGRDGFGRRDGGHGEGRGPYAQFMRRRPTRFRCGHRRRDATVLLVLSYLYESKGVKFAVIRRS